MSEDIAGRGDPIKTLQLMWGRVEAPKRGPKSRVAVADLVMAAVRIADAEGIDAVSTRRVAEAVGISPMSFYTHIPDKAVLLDLMLDAVAGPAEDHCVVPPILTEAQREGADVVPPVLANKRRDQPNFAPEDWRANVAFVAREYRAFYLRHSWVLQVATHRPVMGPNTLRAYEYFLSAFDGLGLSEVEMDMSVSLVANYVHGAVRDLARSRMVKDLTGMSDDEWWYAIAPFLETLDYSSYPTVSRVGPVVGELYGLGDPDLAFNFGLERMLDGLAILIEGKVR